MNQSGQPAHLTYREEFMHLDQIQKTWRKTLVDKLQDRYGLDEKEAETKADAWLRWVTREAKQNGNAHRVPEPCAGGRSHPRAIKALRN